MRKLANSELVGCPCKELCKTVAAATQLKLSDPCSVLTANRAISSSSSSVCSAAHLDTLARAHSPSSSTHRQRQRQQQQSIFLFVILKSAHGKEKLFAAWSSLSSLLLLLLTLNVAGERASEQWPKRRENLTSGVEYANDSLIGSIYSRPCGQTAPLELKRLLILLRRRASGGRSLASATTADRVAEPLKKEWIYNKCYCSQLAARSFVVMMSTLTTIASHSVRDQIRLAGRLSRDQTFVCIKPASRDVAAQLQADKLENNAQVVHLVAGPDTDEMNKKEELRRRLGLRQERRMHAQSGWLYLGYVICLLLCPMKRILAAVAALHIDRVSDGRA